MKAHWQYLKYVVRHKYWVWVGCRKLGVGWWQALTHDWSKFLPAEWLPYVAKFYGPKYPPLAELSLYHRSWAITLGHHKEAVDEAFNRAWLHHIHAQPHHWQHWLLQQDNGTMLALPIPDKYQREMVADWYGAGRAITGKNDLADWYAKNRDKMVMDQYTREAVNALVAVASSVLK